MRAPWASAICLTMASPSPLPPGRSAAGRIEAEEGIEHGRARVFGDAGAIVVD